MYTHDDYLRDLYVREHGSGARKSEAEMRCIDYEHGRDPELAPKMRKSRNEKLAAVFGPIFSISLALTLIIGCGSGFPQLHIKDLLEYFDSNIIVRLFSTIAANIIR